MVITSLHFFTILSHRWSSLDHIVSVQLSSVAQLCPTLCDPMDCSTPGLPVHHQLPESTQTHVHRVTDAIQPSHPLSSPSPPAPNPSQHQSFPMSQLFTWGGQSTGDSALTSFLTKKSLGWSPSEWTGWISLQSKDSQDSSPTPQFKSLNSSALNFLHSPTLTMFVYYIIFGNYSKNWPLFQNYSMQFSWYNFQILADHKVISTLFWLHQRV